MLLFLDTSLPATTSINVTLRECVSFADAYFLLASDTSLHLSAIRPLLRCFSAPHLVSAGQWQPRLGTDYQYKFSNETATFVEAKAACQAEGSHLAYLTDEDERDYVMNLMPKYVINRNTFSPTPTLSQLLFICL